MRKPTPARVAVPLALLAVGALALLLVSPHVARAQDRAAGVQRVKTIGFTVADVERESNFFANVLQFEKIADFRVVGTEYDALTGVFNSNMRIVQLKLGEQIIELTQYVSPPTGRNIPVWSQSNDAWFEHMAIVVGDMDAEYKILQDNNVRQISSHPITRVGRSRAPRPRGLGRKNSYPPLASFFRQRFSNCLHPRTWEKRESKSGPRRELSPRILAPLIRMACK